MDMDLISDFFVLKFPVENYEPIHGYNQKTLELEDDFKKLNLWLLIAQWICGTAIVQCKQTYFK